MEVVQVVCLFCRFSGLALLNASSLEELSEIRLLMDAGICFMMLGRWLDFLLMYCGWSFGFL